MVKTNGLDPDRVRALIDRMRVEDTNFRVYSAGWHGYRFGPVLKDADVSAFEAEHQVQLPDDYRFFLTRIGNGGAWPEYRNIIGRNPGPGPGCGMFPLIETIRGSDVSKPFPLTESTATTPFEGTDDWDDTIPFPGALQICYRGGGSFSLLVVNGPQYGMIWDQECDACPTDYNPTGHSFGDWYSRWLDRVETVALPILARQRDIAGAEVGMTEEQVVKICGPAERKMERPGSLYRYILSYPKLATDFQMGADDTVGRICRFGISIN